MKRTISLDEAERLSQKPKQRVRFKVVPVADIDFDPDADAGGLIDGLLPTTGVAQLYGRWKSFKSFVALDLAWAVAAKLPTWAGRAIKRRGAVVYIACEGQGRDGMHKRIAAYKRSHSNGEPPPLYLVEARPDFGRADSPDLGELATAIRAALPDDFEVVLIVVDTLVRTLHGRDENGEGMRNFLDNAEDLSAAFNCLVLAVHHEGSGDNDRSRGSTVLPAGVVATWHVKKQPGELRCTLTIKEAKDSVSDYAFDVTLRPFEFADEHAERRASTLMVERIEPAAAPSSNASKKSTKPPPTLRVFMTTVEIAMHNHGNEYDLPHNDGPDVKPARVKAVTLDLLRNTYYAKRPDLDNSDSRGAAFRRQLEAAVARELLVSGMINRQPMVWRP